MNILVDARPLCTPAPGGVTRVTRQLLEEVFAANNTTTYGLATTGSRRPLLPWPEDATRCSLHRYCPNKLVSSLATTRLVSFETWFPTFRADLLFLPNIGFVGAPRLPYLLLVHDLTFLTEPRWYSWRGRLWHKAVHALELITRATHLVTLSTYVKEELQGKLSLPSERITVLPYRPTFKTIPTDLPANLKNKRFLLCLGAGDRRKNTPAVIRAWEAVRRDHRFHTLEMVVIGPSLPSFAESLPGIHYLSRPDDALLTSLYQHAAVFCYPSWSEGYGLPLHEAAHFRTPCIASTGSALEETAPAGTVFVPPEKPHLLTEALLFQLEHPCPTTTKDPSSTTTGNTLYSLFQTYARS